jgi:hypothetical protein
MSIINNFHDPNFMREFLSIRGIFHMILGTSSFWMMGIFSLFAFMGAIGRKARLWPSM